MKSVQVFIFIFGLLSCVAVLGQTNPNSTWEFSCKATGPFNPLDIERLNNLVKKLTGEIKELSSTCIKNRHLQPNFYVDYCSVGVKDRRVTDAQMTASSIYNNQHAAYQGRLDYQGSSNPFRSAAWVSAQSDRVGSWLQVDLLLPTFVTGIVTQGRGQDTWANQMVTSYKIFFANQTNAFRYITDKMGRDVIFRGNTDGNTYVMNRFPRPITARYFRLVVYTYNVLPNVRLEYITC